LGAANRLGSQVVLLAGWSTFLGPAAASSLSTFLGPAAASSLPATHSQSDVAANLTDGRRRRRSVTVNLEPSHPDGSES